ncbi:MAG: hypothetical protein RL329_1066 [Bacteroidota bacterium]|jgi:hypothetical protein
MFDWLNWFKKKKVAEPPKRETNATPSIEEKLVVSPSSEKERYSNPSETAEAFQREKKVDKVEGIPKTLDTIPTGHLHIYTNQGFHQKYKAQDFKNYAELVEGSFKMLEGYFRDLERKLPRKEPLNHPLNLDQAVEEGLGFKLYGQFLGMDEPMIRMLLAVALIHFIIHNDEGQFYEANEPESPLKKMVVRVNRNETALLFYPLEYTMNVLCSERTFASLYNQLQTDNENFGGAD